MQFLQFNILPYSLKFFTFLHKKNTAALPLPSASPKRKQQGLSGRGRLLFRRLIAFKKSQVKNAFSGNR
jgi:hypothetical protein